MMRHRDPNRLGDKVIFWVALAFLLGFIIEASYNLGVTHGNAQAQPAACPAPKKSLYDLTTHQLRRMIRYEKAKGM